MDNRRVAPWITKGSNVIITVTQGVTPPGPRGKKEKRGPTLVFSVDVDRHRPGHQEFFVFYGLNCH